jgi:uncharacterized protein YdeI (YjbR/CyaY-like superfamily)
MADLINSLLSIAIASLLPCQFKLVQVNPVCGGLLGLKRIGGRAPHPLVDLATHLSRRYPYLNLSMVSAFCLCGSLKTYVIHLSRLARVTQPALLSLNHCRVSMATKAPPTDLQIQAFSSADDFEEFLDREHTTRPGIHVKFAKKASGIPSITHAEAIEVALCFGWIDGRANPFDDKYFLARFTPRRAKSTWSQKNVDTVGRLMEAGKVRPAGIAAVDAAKADGRWARAYATPTNITVPDDLAEAIAAVPAATAAFDSLNKTDRYMALMRLEIGVPKNRAKRIEKLVKTLAEGKQPSATAKPAATTKKNVPTKKVVKKKATQEMISAGKDLSRAKPARPSEPSQPRRAGLRSRA